MKVLLAACVAGIDGSTGRGCLHMKLLRPTRLRMTPRIRGPVSCCLSSTSSLAPVEEQLEGWKPGWHDAPEYPCREGQFATGYDVGRTFEMLDARTYGPWWPSDAFGGHCGDGTTRGARPASLGMPSTRAA